MLWELKVNNIMRYYNILRKNVYFAMLWALNTKKIMYAIDNICSLVI